MDVLHSAMWVDDVEAMDEFYTEGLGLERTREFVGGDGATNRFFAGESDAEIQLKFVEGEEDDDPTGFDHVAIAVADIEATIDTLGAEFGSELVRGPKLLEEKGVRIAFVTDPEGYVVELIEEVSE
ncbi:lactoylglutathione lyase [Halorubrum sp. JWXQ-INN 858]|uniref:VOC family protein n=1 Tax=Halorubrum sp. JWXQ-INN 858 TaxID=2690782 RepID=UPI00135B9459|nr:VOC family protein [Halorubrum sp. JWXQ-INN 858]MWV65578.1 lactoylglutathione lyase [Halorubrum sp. JWXQ-INN 858]